MNISYMLMEALMNLDDMKMLLTIARTGSLTAAAQALFVSQPALSKRLSRLEQEVDARLFERIQGSHRMVLTPAGKLLIPFAEKWDALQQDLGMLHDLNSRVHFFVDTVGTVGETVLLDAVYRFSRENPDTELVVRRHDSRDCYGSIHDRTADIAFVVQEQFFQNLSTTPLFQEDMLLLTGPASPFSGTADIRELEWEKEIVIPWNSEYMRWRQNHLRYTRHPNVSLWSLPMAVPFLLNDGCWMMVPRTEADRAARYCPELKCMPVSVPPPARTVYWVEEFGRHHEAADTLLDILRRQLKDREGIHLL